MNIYPLLSYPTLSPKQPPMRGEQSRIASIWIAHSHARRAGTRHQRIKRSLSVTLSLTFIYSHESFSIEPLNLVSDIKAKYQDSWSLRKGQRHYLKLWAWCQDQLTHSSLAAIHQAWAQYFKPFSQFTHQASWGCSSAPSAPLENLLAGLLSPQHQAMHRIWRLRGLLYRKESYYCWGTTFTLLGL